MVKFDITVVYQKRKKALIREKTYLTGDYDEAMYLLGNDLKNEKISEDAVVSYKVVKIIQCPHCGADLPLTRFNNTCTCGAAFDLEGNEMLKK